jgi:hypothetical protein
LLQQRQAVMTLRPAARQGPQGLQQPAGQAQVWLADPVQLSGALLQAPELGGLPQAAQQLAIVAGLVATVVLAELEMQQRADAAVGAGDRALIAAQPAGGDAGAAPFLRAPAG